MTLKKSILFFTLAFMCYQAQAAVTLPKLISNGMVLQRDSKINVWGWADNGEKITIVFKGKTYKTTAGPDHKWSIQLSPASAGGPFNMKISGKNSIEITDILVGDVFLCSGQSNMVLTMERVKEKYPDDVAMANYPTIRNFLVPTYSDVIKTHDDLPSGKWVATTPSTVMEFGAVAFFFARKIQSAYNIPVGIINASVGGTPAEAWVSENGLKNIPEFTETIKGFKDSTFIKSISNPAPASNTSNPVTDEGLKGPVKWYDTSYVAMNWHSFWLPGYWADQGIKNLNGVVWFRKEIILPSEIKGKPAKLFMGRIIDADQTYMNGTFVGNITYQYPPRRYNVQAGVLKPGKNIIVVRVTNTANKGGFVPDKPYSLSIGETRFDLKGEWQYKVGDVFTKPEKLTPPPFSAQNAPTGLYNTMIKPLIPYTIKGINWYQGEANTGRPESYSAILSALIADWRLQWNQGSIPFAFVQLANFMEVQYSPMESQWATLRNEQRKTLSVPNTAMAVTIDAGEWNDIHPLNKKDVGERLAIAMQHLAYADSKIVYSGPLYQSKEIKGNTIVLTFSNIGSGLMAKGDDALQYFEIAGSDRKYVKANARIEGEKVIVWSDKIINTPLYVRYAWADNPEWANLYNKDGLPASPFQTDN